MQQKIIAFIKQHRMIEKNDHVIVACSGGADSVCLLLVLCTCRQELGCSLSAVHVEHGIRGEESRRDAAFTKALCERLSIPLTVVPVEVPAYAAARGIGLEEAARELRYDALRQCAARKAADPDVHGRIRTALAHHMEDNAETMLFSLARGSGLAGLGGIAPVRTEGSDCYIRPLLGVTREEIEAYLADRGQLYCTDRTNLDETYARNRIRRSILPLLADVNVQAVQHMNRSAEKISEAYDFIHKTAEIKYMELAAEARLDDRGTSVGAAAPDGRGHAALRAAELLALHPAVRQEVLRIALFETAGRKKDIAAVHVEALERLLALQSGRRLSLPYGIFAFMEYDVLHVCRTDEAGQSRTGLQPFLVTEEALRRCVATRDPADDAAAAEVQNCPPEGIDVIPWHTLWDDGDGAFLRARVWEAVSPLEEITKKAYTKQFDYDKMNSGFLVRNRQKGDYFVLDREGHRKKLSDYMINQKIPARRRGSIPLLARGSEVLWLVGDRISATAKVSKDTKRILELEFYGGMSDGL